MKLIIVEHSIYGVSDEDFTKIKNDFDMLVKHNHLEGYEIEEIMNKVYEILKKYTPQKVDMVFGGRYDDVGEYKSKSYTFEIKKELSD